jgi:hypothetical protein
MIFIPSAVNGGVRGVDLGYFWVELGETNLAPERIQAAKKVCVGGNNNNLLYLRL